MINFEQYIEESMAVSLDDLTKQRIIFSSAKYDPTFDLMTPAEMRKRLKALVDKMIRKAGMKVNVKAVPPASFDLFFKTKDDLNKFSKKYLTSDLGVMAGITVKPPTLPDPKKDKKWLNEANPPYKKWATDDLVMDYHHMSQNPQKYAKKLHAIELEMSSRNEFDRLTSEKDKRAMRKHKAKFAPK